MYLKKYWCNALLIDVTVESLEVHGWENGCGRVGTSTYRLISYPLL